MTKQFNLLRKSRAILASPQCQQHERKIRPRWLIGDPMGQCATILVDQRFLSNDRRGGIIQVGHQL